jgi:membrane protease YdiL (CAAX protease family)
MNDLPAGAETPAPSPSPQLAAPPAPQSVLAGPEGLRAGWRLLVYIVLVFALGSILWGWLHRWHPAGPGRLWLLMAEEVVQLIALILPAVLMARLEGRRFGAYGFPLRDFLSKWLFLGAVWGIASLSLFMMVLWLLHGFTFGPVQLHGARIYKFAAFWGVFFVLVGFVEEFAFRGYTLFTIADGLEGLSDAVRTSQPPRESETVGFWIAAVVMSGAFGSVHISNRGENWVGVLAVFVIGMFWCLTLRRTGSLWFAVGFHAAFDWGESYLYSVPDSGTVLPGHLLHSSIQGPAWLTGGSVGPEGSVLMFVLMGLLALAFHRAFPQVRYRVSGSSAGVP